ncbi:ADP-ribosylglycohydrolase family protein [Halegenticoccus soli]|uniref:ADP-ribosylglycohydrolase family protein n=1 Tax=Halegenticoccus soli TaxID=1985678 RepID=UPI000C6D6027|nr:ADP-ribosylglycohydrolase family protein [Halegenticoccus soli]
MARQVTHATGVFLGLACGDALGRPVEGLSADQIQATYGTLTEMVGGGVHDRSPGTVTDDTELALCIARSLAHQGTYDPKDIVSRFVEWYREGAFGGGRMTRKVLHRIDAGEPWEITGKRVWSESAEGTNAGNGSVMRCAPLAVTYPTNFGFLDSVSRHSSLLTHADLRCTYGCSVLNLTLAGILTGREDPLSIALSRVEEDAPRELIETLSALPDDVDPAALEPSGYVVDTLRTALYYGLTAPDAQSAIINAVNAGGDTDTVAAIAGAVAGARHGVSSLPQRWIDTVDHSNELTQLARTLWKQVDATEASDLFSR